MALKFSTGKRSAPIWVHLYGPEGIGKSSFAADAPDPTFFDIEQGTNNLDTARVTFDVAGDRTRPVTFAEVIGAFVALRTEAHPYKTIVIDTVDALEALIWAHVCANAACKSIEDFGYGKGYVIALNPWRQVIDEIEALRLRGHNVITLGHALIKPFKNPEGEDFDRYIPKLHEKAGALIKERADAVLFANYRNATRKDAQTKRVRGVTDKARLIHTQRTAAFDAKNRYDLPEEMPLSWASFFAAVQAHKPADPGTLRAAIMEKLERLPEDARKEGLGYLQLAGSDAVKLSKLNSWVNAKSPDLDSTPASERPLAGRDGAAAANLAVTVNPENAATACGVEPTAPKPERKLEPVETKPAPVVEPQPAAPEEKTLTPGNDPPSMDEPKPNSPEDLGAKRPAEEPPTPAPAAKVKTPKEIATDEILDAADQCKTPADLARRVLPLIQRAMNAKLFSPAEIEGNRAWYTELALTLKKGAAK